MSITGHGSRFCQQMLYLPSSGQTAVQVGAVQVQLLSALLGKQTACLMSVVAAFQAALTYSPT